MMPHFMKRLSDNDRSSKSDSQPGGCMYLSGLPPGEELIPECEVIFEDEDDGLDSNYDWCEKNPKHKHFIPLCDFSMDHLPTNLRTEKVMDYIQPRVDLTVRIRIPYTSMERPDFIPSQEPDKRPYPYMHHKGNKKFTRNGTGTVISVSPAVNKPCPCVICQEDRQPRNIHFLLTVRTVTHNVFNNEEARQAVVDCFFNNENDETEGIIKKIYGLHIDQSDGKRETMYKTDVCDMVCVSHDVETVERLSKLLSSVKAMPDLPASGPFTSVIVSHPHGCTKRISVGEIPYLTIPLEPGYKTNTPSPFPQGTTTYYADASSKTKEESSEIPIPPGTTFTLSSTAPYAMRYHFSRPRNYLSFPPETKLVGPDRGDGQSTWIVDDAGFEAGDGFSPNPCYAGNIVGSCAGTSGAMVYSNLVEDEVLTDLAHTSTLRRGTRLQ